MLAQTTFLPTQDGGLNWRDRQVESLSQFYKLLMQNGLRELKELRVFSGVDFLALGELFPQRIEIELGGIRGVFALHADDHAGAVDQHEFAVVELLVQTHLARRLGKFALVADED